jgi:hypothetical protein
MRYAAGVAIAFLLAVAPGNAQAREYPWCAEMPIDFDYVSTCGYVTFEQCLATISGVGGFCKRNPRYGWGPPPPAQKIKKHRR